MGEIRYFNVEKEDLLCFDRLCEKDVMDRFGEHSIGVGAVEEAEDGPKAVGILYGSMKMDGFAIDWIYVDKDSRRQGIGSTLMDLLYQALTPIVRCAGIMGVYAEDHEDLMGFFEANDYTTMEAEDCIQFNAKLGDMKGMFYRASADGNMFHLKDVPMRAKTVFEDTLLNTEDVPGMVELPIDPAKYDEESLCYVSNDRIDAIMLLSKTKVTIGKSSKKGYNIDWAYASPNSKIAMPALVGYMKKNMVETHGGETRISFTSLNEQSFVLGNDLFPDAEKVGFMMAVRALPEQEQEA